MGIKIKSVSESIEDNGLKALVHAPPGTGKTVLCATALAPTLIISAEAGLLSLDQEVEKLRDEGSPDFDPSFCSVAEVTTLDELAEVCDILEDAVRSGKREYDWIALDSGTEIAEKILANEMADAKDPRKAYGALQTKMLSILKDFRDLPEYNVIVTSKQQKQTDETSNLTMYMPMMPGSKLHQQIPYLFDEVWCMRIGVDEDEDGEKFTFHYIQAKRDMQYDAKDRSGKLEEVEPPSLYRLHAKIYGEGHKVPRKTYNNSEEKYLTPEQMNSGDLSKDEEKYGQCEHGMSPSEGCEKCDEEYEKEGPSVEDAESAAG